MQEHDEGQAEAGEDHASGFRVDDGGGFARAGAGPVPGVISTIASIEPGAAGLSRRREADELTV